MVKIVILAPGSGSNSENMVEHVESGKLGNTEVTALCTDHQNAFCINRVKKHDTPVYTNGSKQFDSKVTYEQHLVTLLSEDKVGRVTPAGYMRLISPSLLTSFEGKALSVHPSLLPKYKGIDAIGQVYHSDDTITGSAVHYVDSGMGTGKTIEQRQCDIRSSDSRERLEEKVKKLEYELYLSATAKTTK